MTDETIVVIEDEEDILEVIEYNLEREGYRVQTSRNGEEGLGLVREQHPDLVILDLMLPDRDGLEICKELRGEEETQSIPIIMVTAKDTDSDVMLGFGVGADDYLTKPFNPVELVARVKAVLRRTGADAEPAGERKFRHGELMIDPERHEARYDGDPLQLSATQFRLLTFLASNPGRVYERSRLVEEAMENRFVSERNIDVHIRTIREQLGEARDLIETVRGVGYRLREVDE